LARQSKKPQLDASKWVFFEVDGKLREAGHFPWLHKVYKHYKRLSTPKLDD
jgi:hypothetical protein